MKPFQYKYAHMVTHGEKVCKRVNKHKVKCRVENGQVKQNTILIPYIFQKVSVPGRGLHIKQLHEYFANTFRQPLFKVSPHHGGFTAKQHCRDKCVSRMCICVRVNMYLFSYVSFEMRLFVHIFQAGKLAWQKESGLLSAAGHQQSQKQLAEVVKTEQVQRNLCMI